MCRKAKYCTELGTDPSKWSSRTPLPQPSIFTKYFDSFVQAFNCAQERDFHKALVHLDLVDGEALRTWYIEHGQMAGRFRASASHNRASENKSIEHQKRSISAALAREVYMRDRFVCRYCSNRVIGFNALILFQSWVGTETFNVRSRKNVERHGISLVFRATIDHVLPISQGGKTVLENLVTACWSCNYGKAGYRLEDIKIENPCRFEPVIWDDWTGLNTPCIE